MPQSIFDSYQMDPTYHDMVRATPHDGMRELAAAIIGQALRDRHSTQDYGASARAFLKGDTPDMRNWRNYLCRICGFAGQANKLQELDMTVRIQRRVAPNRSRGGKGKRKSADHDKLPNTSYLFSLE